MIQRQELSRVENIRKFVKNSVAINTVCLFFSVIFKLVTRQAFVLLSLVVFCLFFITAVLI